MKPPKDLEEAREVGLEVGLEEVKMEVEVQDNATTTKKKFIWTDTALTQDDHGACIAGIMGTQLKTIHN
jgi:hypothetical protein